MFETVAIDLHKVGNSERYDPYYQGYDPREARLFPFVYLIAEKIIESGNTARPHGSGDFIQTAYLINEGRPNIVDYGRDHVLLSASQAVKATALKWHGLRLENAVLVLAAAGLQISLPNLTLDIARSDEIQEIKSKLLEERKDFIHAMSKMADETYQRLVSGYYQDTVDWALNEAFVKIRPKSEKFESSVKKLDRKLLQRVSLNFFEEGLPVIGSTLSEKGYKDASKEAIRVLLEVIAKNLSLRIEERKVPEVVYGFKLKKRMKRTGLTGATT